MTDFEPSPDFVDRVMTVVRSEVESAAAVETKTLSGWLASTPLRWSLALGGAVVTVVNLVRILAAVFAPALCR